MRTLIAACFGLALAGPATAQSIRFVTRTPGDSTAYSYRLHVPAGQPRGLLVLVGNWGNTVREFDVQQVRIQEQLAARGIATMMLANTPWRQNYFADRPVEIVDSMIASLLAELGLPRGRYIAGGLQMGGTASLRLAQRCARTICAAGAPAGVFGVDPVVNFERFWRSRTEHLLGPEDRSTAGFRMMTRVIARELGGTPDDDPSAYRATTVYDAGEPDGGNARLLAGTALRLYVNPDTSWHRQHWGTDSITSGLADITGLAALLRRVGNDRAELIAVSGRSVLPDGRPSPHAWAMIDEADLAAWTANLLARGAAGN